MIAFLTSRAGIALAAVIAALAAVVWLLHEGGEIQKGKDAKATTETQRRIDDADARGPRTFDDADKRLKDGRF